ncbi:App1 family protein [Pengzhenrongella phosphoraccumulans]|uniref:App1 family protein n=1 Tax=Pengzhenrongella phosphoraccumulans TaxID=3114394 RepID=UPI0038910558
MSFSSAPSPSTRAPTVPPAHRRSRFESGVRHRAAQALWKHGWRTRVEPYAGYGAPGWVRVMGRTVLAPPSGRSAGEGPHHVVPRDRGWRNLITAQVQGVEVFARADAGAFRMVSDDGGYLDAVVPVNLPPGWHQVELACATGRVHAPVFVVGADTTAGIVSDIDDTVMITSAPWPLLAVWNTFVVHETTRRPVPGMADLFDDLLREHPGAPVMYLSTRAWNAAPAIRRFLGRFGYPAGPLLLTDWGPTRTGWFRDGADHKRAMLRRLTAEFPQIQWILVGDDGQRDPKLYTELALEQPDRVRAVAIRQLSGAEQAIVHGSPAKPSAAQVALQRTAAAGVPVIAARNGIRLAEGLREAGIDLS